MTLIKDFINPPIQDINPNLYCRYRSAKIRKTLYKTHLKENLLKYGVYVTKYDTELGIGDISGRITSCNPKLVRYSFSGLDSSKIKAGLISSGESGEYITSGGRLITV
jgi:hypothetical protein